MYHQMKKALFSSALCGLLGWSAVAVAQQKDAGDPALKLYRASATKINDLVHTKLDVRFDYGKRYMYGKEWVTLHPHFYATDSLTLDAKGMNINAVALVRNGRNTDLHYTYSDSLQLRIKLDRTYKADEQYTIYIDYTAKPDEYKAEGSAAITDAKGLYFINPDGKDPNKPTEIWTQGESESSSVWFPTIDKSNQKSTSEISITVDKKYKTLSNGLLVKQVTNANGTRTDTWKLDQPFAPYLFMMAIGDYAIVKDTWHGKEVSYYVEPAYEKYAHDIFGDTPEMLSFYSRILGVEYPWPKYSQVIARDYVSGAMENVTATLHGQFVQKTDRELLDDDRLGNSVIAHELFHHWFGDLVTCESWSNLTVNESFADYSEYLWFEHKFGKDAADEHAYDALQSYFRSAQYSGDKDLVRFYYHDKEDMFDAITYQKGGCILHMLRAAVGDSAFFKSLNLYLKTYAYKATEAHQLRLAVEEVTGRDMNWFFNQWYYGSGYPELDLNYAYDENTHQARVFVKQVQKANKVWELPMAVDVYAGGKKERHMITLRERADTFTFSSPVKPDLVNVDAEKVTVMKKNDHRDLATYVFQYFNAPYYLDRREALDICLKQQSNADARKVVLAAVEDKFEGLREYAIDGLKLDDEAVKTAIVPVLADLAKNDPFAKVRAAALAQLGKLADAQYEPLFESKISDRSYAVEGQALVALSAVNPDKAFTLAHSLEKDAKGELTSGIAEVYVKKGDASSLPFFKKHFEEASAGQEKFDAAVQYIGILSTVSNTEEVNHGFDQIKEMADQFHNPMVNNYLINILTPVLEKKQAAAKSATGTEQTGLNEQAAHLQGILQSLKAQKPAAEQE
ncbi:MAG TPA: M1 family metallopeptidase [Chitinophaga sp.]